MNKELELYELQEKYNEMFGSFEEAISTYPNEWFDDEDIENKISIIKKAIKEKKKISDVTDDFEEKIIFNKCNAPEWDN